MGREKHHQSSRRNYHQNKPSGHFHPGSSSNNTIQVGQHGFFVSFSASKESFVRNEVYNLLNRFGDQLFGAEFTQEKELDTADLTDLDSALENEKSKLKETKKAARRFRIVKSGTKHSLFVCTTLPITSLNQLVESIFQTSLQDKEQHSRYVERLLPVSFICKAYEDDLRKLIIKKEFVEQLLTLIDGSNLTENTVWFDVQAKKSNNNQVKSSHLEEIIISDLVSRKSDDLNGKMFKRDYKKPQLCILLHVIKSVILISVVRNYDLFKKYNLASINLTTTMGEKLDGVQQQQQEEEGEEQQQQQQQQQQQKKITFDDSDEEDEADDKDDLV